MRAVRLQTCSRIADHNRDVPLTTTISSLSPRASAPLATRMTAPTLMSPRYGDGFDGLPSSGILLLMTTSSERRRGGKEWYSTCRSGWSPDTQKNKDNRNLDTERKYSTKHTT